MRNILLLVLVLSFSIADAHNGSIAGKVLVKGQNSPLAGATVTIANSNRGATTNAFGDYQITGLPYGSQTVIVSFLGYRTISKLIEIKEGETLEVNLQLEPGLVDISEVTVQSQEQKPLSTISDIDISVRPVQNSQEVLRMVPGLFIAQHAGGGKAEQIFLRGFDIDHGTDMRITLDGMPVNMVSHTHGQGYSDLHFVIPETIEQVDYGKGPYQADQGNFATAGYASFKSLKSITNSSIKLEGGLYNTYRAVGMFDLLGNAARQKQQYAYIATEYRYSDGYFNSPQYFNRLNIFGRYQGLIGKDKILSLSLSSFSSKWDASGQIPKRAVSNGLINRFGAIDDTEGGVTARRNINLLLTSILPNGATLDNQLFYSAYDFDLFSNFTFYLQDPVNGDQIRQQETRKVYGYTGRYTQEGRLFNKRLKSEAGIEMRYDIVNGSKLTRTKGRKITLSEAIKGDIEEVNTAMFLRESLEINSKLNFNFAIRLDQFMFNYQSLLSNDSTYNRHVNTEFKLSPKANIFYNHSPVLQFYFSAGKGFHSNDTRVSVQATNLNVLPSAYGADFGINYKPLPPLLVHVALWRLDLDQELVYVGDEAIVEPSGKTRRYGLDISARYQFTKSLYADADASFTKPRAKDEIEGNNYIPLAPLITGSGGLTLRAQNCLIGGLRIRYLHNRPANEDYSLTASGYTLTDITIGYKFNKIELNLSAENLFDTEWEEAQFETTSQLKGESNPITEIHFTPGSPLFIKSSVNYRF